MEILNSKHTFLQKLLFFFFFLHKTLIEDILKVKETLKMGIEFTEFNFKKLEDY